MTERTFTKHRDAARPGSIPDLLEMFPREVRFYREVAPDVGVRVPVCHLAEEHEGATHLELEDLSSWQEGADPAAAARLLRRLHDRWSRRAVERWPWLPRADVSDLVERLYDDTWPDLRSRADLTPSVRALGEALVGRAREMERAAEAAGPPTLVHGDASARNMRTSPDGEIALLDWEDVGTGPGVADLAWHLVSSVPPASWDAVIAAYGGASLDDVLPAACVQELLSLSGEDVGTDDSRASVDRLGEVARRLGHEAG